MIEINGYRYRESTARRLGILPTEQPNDTESTEPATEPPVEPVSTEPPAEPVEETDEAKARAADGDKARRTSRNKARVITSADVEGEPDARHTPSEG